MKNNNKKKRILRKTQGITRFHNTRIYYILMQLLSPNVVATALSTATMTLIICPIISFFVDCDIITTF